MKKRAANSYFFDDKPIFGLDIGRSTARVIQLHSDSLKHKPKVIGYGEISFDASLVRNGVIIKPTEMAAAIQKLFKHSLVGDITTRRVALSLPIAHAYTRSIELPKLNEKELSAAIQSEIDEYIPAASESLYVDYSAVKTSADTWSTFIVAVPRRIVDSYLTVCRLLWLEPVIIQTSSGAGSNLFKRDENGDLPSVLVDFGSESADITVLDKTPIVSGTVAFGGEEVTNIIAKTLDVNQREAVIIKTKYGLSYSKKQRQIETALKPSLDTLVREIQRSVRYYDERSKGKRPIAQIVIMGGGANMPGLADYLTNSMRVPVRAFDPTHFLDFGRLQPLNMGERMSYVTAAGLAILRAEDAF